MIFYDYDTPMYRETLNKNKTLNIRIQTVKYSEECHINFVKLMKMLYV